MKAALILLVLVTLGDAVCRADALTAHGLPASVVIHVAWEGLGSAAPETYTIRLQSTTSSTTFAAVRRLVTILGRPPVARPTLAGFGMTTAWLASNAEGGVADYLASFTTAALDQRQRNLFTTLFRDRAKALTWMDDEYGLGRTESVHTDDYPSATLHVGWADGTSVDARTGSQSIYMLPWNGGSRGKTYDPDLSRAVAALLRPGTLNRNRLAGKDARSSYSAFIVADSQGRFDSIDAEDRLTSQLDPLRNAFRIDSSQITRMSSDDLDGQDIVALHLRPIVAPRNVTIDMALWYANGRIDAGKAIDAADRYVRLVAGVPWLSEYLRQHPNTVAQIRVVQDRSLSQKLGRDLEADLRAHGKPALAEAIHRTLLTSAFVYVNGPRGAYARWFVLPDHRTILWNYKGATPLQPQLAGLKTWDWYGHVGVGAIFTPEGQRQP